MNEIMKDFEVGKVYTNHNLASRWLLLHEINNRRYWFDLEKMTSHYTDFGDSYLLLDPDQSHNITIDIKPNKPHHQNAMEK